MSEEAMYYCEDCGQPAEINEPCIVCGGKMVKLDDQPKPKKAHPGDGDELSLEDEALLTAEEIAAGEDDGTLSLEALREDEDGGDANYNADNDNY
jgi:hypothetical protein